jgi:Zn-dependent peptidase ImmA (M78 family)
MRFTAAHELGHLLCGFPEREGAESLCHAFAGAFLLPRDAVERALMPARRKISLWELKQKYGIIALERAAALAGVSPAEFLNELGEIY